MVGRHRSPGISSRATERVGRLRIAQLRLGDRHPATWFRSPSRSAPDKRSFPKARSQAWVVNTAPPFQHHRLRLRHTRQQAQIRLLFKRNDKHRPNYPRVSGNRAWFRIVSGITQSTTRETWGRLPVQVVPFRPRRVKYACLIKRRKALAGERKPGDRMRTICEGSSQRGVQTDATEELRDQPRVHETSTKNGRTRKRGTRGEFERRGNPVRKALGHIGTH